MLVRLLLVLATVAFAAPRAALAQQGPPKVSERDMAVLWATGRYVTPVTCRRNDDSLIHLEEAVTVRKAPQHGGEHTLKATFFGIDVADVKYCQNLMSKRLSDRRGVVYFTFRGGTRDDLGMRDFRQLVSTGVVTYHVQSGRIYVRPIGEEPGEPRVIDYGGTDTALRLLDIAPRSDPDRMLARLAEKQGAVARGSRRFELRIDSSQADALPEGASFHTFLLEDLRADERGHRRKRK